MNFYAEIKSQTSHTQREPEETEETREESAMESHNACTERINNSTKQKQTALHRPTAQPFVAENRDSWNDRAGVVVGAVQS